MPNSNIKFLFIYLIPVLLLGVFIGSFVSFKSDKRSTIITDCLFDKGINVRSGIPNVKNKILKGAKINIVYFGGSITYMDGWRGKTTEWLNNTFTNATFTEFNSCISGSGSFLGVYRLEDDVIRYKPDLVFIEFAVNDSINSYYISKQLKNNFDEMVCRIKQSKPDTDIVFVYTVNNDMLKGYEKGIASASSKEMEKIADKYDIPSVDFGYRTAFLHKNGLLKFNDKEIAPNGLPVFSGDGVHPLFYGHIIYFGLIKKFFYTALTQIVSESKNIAFLECKNIHKLFSVETFNLLPCKSVSMNYGKDSVFSKPNLVSFDWSDQALNFKVSGSTFGILISMPDGNYDYTVEIDEDGPNSRKLFGFGATSPRIYYSEFDLPKDKEHHFLKIRKSNSDNYNLIYFLSDGNIEIVN